MSSYNPNAPRGFGAPQPGGYQPPGGQQISGGYPGQPGGFGVPGGQQVSGGYPGQPGGFGVPGGQQASGGYPGQPGGSYGGQGLPNQMPGNHYGGNPTGKPKTNVILMLVIGLIGVLIIGLVGWMFFGGRDSPQPKPVPTSPSSSSPHQSPSGGGSPSGGNNPKPAPAGDLLDLGNGVTMVLPAGYQVEESEPEAVTITDDMAVIIGKSAALGQRAHALLLIEGYMQEVSGALQNPRLQEPQIFDVGSGGTAGAQCLIGTLVNGGSSTDILLCTAIGVRDFSGVAAQVTVLVPAQGWERTKNPYTETVNSAFDSLFG